MTVPDDAVIVNAAFVTVNDLFTAGAELKFESPA